MRDAGGDDARDRLMRQLLHANEQLVLAALRAQEAADAADEARLEVAESEARFRSLVTTSAAIVWRATAEGRVSVDPDGWRRFTGADVDAAPWGWLRDLHADERERVRGEWAAAVAAGRGYASEHRLRRGDGSYAWVASRAVPIPQEGPAREWIGTMTDVSDRVRVEEAQRRLVVAERMASVGTLAAGVAHEINNPLTYVMINLDLVLEGLAGSGPGADLRCVRELAEMAGHAREGADRVRRIVRGLGTFARPDTEKLAVIDVRDVLETAIDIAFEQVRGRARIVRDYGAAPRVEADVARLGQVFINLLVNAAQAIPAGHPEAQEIRVVTATDAAGRAVIEVRDPGPGIPAEVIGRIFDPFFTTKPVGVGTGLGLSICHNIVTGMGGEIAVESHAGHGTVFRVSLPGTTAVAEATPGAIPAATATRRAVVLVVDDEPIVGAMIARALLAHDVTVVGCARDAVALLEAGRDFDLILSDLMMPVASGMDLHAELARRFPAAAARMVFVSGGAFTPAAAEFLERVPNERLDKPFEIPALRALAERFARSPR